MNDSIDQICINTIRMLAVDMVEAAQSGHPGMPLGAAPMAYLLWSRLMRHNPSNPQWCDRDRFILSAGHGSALLYGLLHLCGYDLPLAELKRFRQWQSKTPGHPELGETPGVETTTGPLGQGFATGVGMALAERSMAARFNKSDVEIVNHYTYAIVSDGDLMEGVASEAASLAGHLKLGKLIYLYDDNQISIEGTTNLAFTEDVEKRFLAYGWQVLRVNDGNDLPTIDAAIRSAQTEPRPTLVMVRTHIGFGSPKQDSASAHGEPLGKDAQAKTKSFFDWPAEPLFHIPAAIEPFKERMLLVGRQHEEGWRRKFESYQLRYPELAQEFIRQIKGDLPTNWDEALPQFTSEFVGGVAKATIATRAASGKVLNALAKKLPELMGGSADLAPSTKTLIDGGNDFTAEQPAGRNLHFGVREHAMGSCVNGMALHGGLIPYAATFLIFSDYMRPAIRLAAIMRQRVIYVFTHDSIGLGEDGPTHQPIEQLVSLRAIPGLTVLRPADANETVAAWKIAIKRQGPTALILSRQNLPVLSLTPTQEVNHGAYILSDTKISAKTAEAIQLIATGAEVHLALQAQKVLEQQKIATRVISMPSWELFAEQSIDYQQMLLPPTATRRMAIEAASPLGWERWVGSNGRIIGMRRFGASAPVEALMQEFGFTVENIVAQAKLMVESGS